MCSLNSNKLNTSKEDQYYSYYWRILETEVKKSIERITNGKMVGVEPYNIH